MKYLVVALGLMFSTFLGGGAFAAPADVAPAAAPTDARPDDGTKKDIEAKGDAPVATEDKVKDSDSQGDDSQKSVKAKEKDKPRKEGKAKPYPLETCIVTDNKLGAMGDEVTMVYEGQEIKFCCKPCKKKFEKEPARYLPKLKPQAK